jgi:hypothetical protein
MNYTLRKVSPEFGTFDQSLGECYGIVNRFENPKIFREYFKQVFNKQHVDDLDESANDDTKNIIGFVTSSKDSIIPIYQGNSFYIVSESGKTLVRVNKCMNRQRPIDYGVETKEVLEVNLLHEFFNSKSDSNKYLEASQQENLEAEFSDWVNKRNHEHVVLS